MTTYTFKVILDRQPSDSDFDRMYEAGCDDAAIGIERGLPVAEFDREDETMADAITSAVHNLESAGFAPLRIVDEDIVSLAEIAQKVGQSREAVRRYSTGERGPGGFPPPVNPGRDGTTFYRWTEVAPWLRTQGFDVEDGDPALAMANLLLQARRFRNRVAHASALSGLLAA